MENMMEKLIDRMEKSGVKIVFGLEAQGHIPTIEAIIKKSNESCKKQFPGENVNMMYSKGLWDLIGRKIGWCPFTACLSYFEYLEKKNENPS